MTLLEILCVLLIVSMMASLVLPSLTVFLQRVYAKNIFYTLQHAIAYARTEAMTGRHSVILCGSEDREHCAVSWNQELILFVHHQVKQRFVFRAQPAFLRGTLYKRFFSMKSDKIIQLTFSTSGMSFIKNGSFWYCLPNAAQPEWALSINKIGRVRTLLKNKRGDILDSKGKPLRC